MNNSSSIAVVTGANGFVGSHLVDYLLNRGYRVRCITRKTSDLKWLKGKEVEIYDCGLFDPEGLRKAFKDAEYIYHVAGVVKSKKPEGYFK
jgi:dihydroflavonol-4-reductase